MGYKFNVFTGTFDIVGSGGGGTTPNFSDNETPAGSVDGINTVFVLAHAPNPAISLMLEFQGQLQYQGIGLDYTLVGNTITMAIAPVSGSILRAWYRY